MFEFLKNLFKSKKQNHYTGEVKVTREPDTETKNETVLIATKEPELVVIHKSNKFEANNVPVNKGKICINNGTVKKFINKDDPIPEGWTLGGLKKK